MVPDHIIQAPQRGERGEIMALTDEVRSQIQATLDANRVVLYMKGNKMFPRCGFSAAVVGALDEMGVEYETVDVLDDPDVRQGIKEFTDWPTIPQLYIDQEFVGGSDIIKQMVATGELHKVLGVTFEEVATPTIHLSDSMVEAFKAASEDQEGEIRIEISTDFRYGVGFTPKSPGDLELEAGGLTILMDRASAKRADGMRLDFEVGPEGGIKVQNPNEPKAVGNLSVQDLQSLLSESAELTLFDVRTEEERATASIDGAIHFDGAGQAQLATLPKDAMVVFHCHHGGRSMAAAEEALGLGYQNVHNVAGGIDAWSVHVDDSVARY
jgi:monothiol glutaredoxin